MQSSLKGLVGEALNSVTFPPEYVQLNFLESTLNVYSKWTIRVAGTQYFFPGPGSRDAICSLLHLAITSVTESPGETRLQFENGAEMMISTRESDFQHEALEYWDKDGKPFIHEK